ncbi:hypothetical protein [uncultured Kordia sp.]|uniref:hypothetical protein n=1 Tax=uncultured Kordia sp. TaxID=507699 RepID=UPI00261BCA97|nr:hypothetical protein [uncultured Kordia sp.]
MKRIHKLIIAFACIVCLQSCNDDDFNSGIGNNPGTETESLRDQQFKDENFGNATTGKFIGRIVDDADNLLQNVQISIGNATTLTDRNGIFILNDVPVFENFAYITAQKEGYINGSRVVIPKTNGTNKIDIVMFKKVVTETVNSGETSTVTLPDGVEVSFSGGFVRQDGSTYNGQVEVVLNYAAPNVVATFWRMPGSLLAQNEANEARNLETYGMISVNLFSPAGESLNIEETSPATLKFPVHYTQTSIAPETINLWYFDEEQGYWKEEGQAVKSGDFYTAEVTHFTWWNCDVPFDSIEFCFNLAPNGATQSTPYYVNINRASNNQLIFSGNVYSGGFECGLIPINEEITVSIFQVASSCFGQLIDTQTFSGYATDTSTEISFTEGSNLSTTNITGTANNCNGNPITNGYLYVDEYNSFSITDGTINIGLQHCESQTATLQLFDFDANQWTIIDNVPLNSQNFDLGTISTCDDFGGIFNGNVTLLSQQQVNEFGAFGLTGVNGDFIIGNPNALTDIVDLTPLASITEITGRLAIIGNENLTSFQGLQNISSVEGYQLLIKNNPAITSLAGFTNLLSVTSLTIDGNNGLTSLAGIHNNFSVVSEVRIMNNSNLTSLQGIDALGLTTENDLRISNNDALMSLEGVENITQLRFLTIEDNDALNSMAAFESLTQVLDLYLNNNDTLVTLVGLEQLMEVRSLIIINHEALENLNGLDNLVTLSPGGFNFINIGASQWENFCDAYIDGPNPNLTDFCAIQTLINAGQWDNNGANQCAVIVNNEYNPTLQDFMDGNCSQ